MFTTKLGVADFRGAEGDVIGIRRPAVLVAREKAWRGDDAIVIDKLVNTKIQVALNRHIYSAVELSPEEETLDEVDYVRDVQAPQVQAVSDFIETVVVGALTGATFVNTVKFNLKSADAAESDPRKVAIRARKLFQQAHVPVTGRFWLVGSDISEAIASYDKLLDVDTSGLPEALREGVVGKLGGFIIIELDALNPTESFFVHESALAIANVAPVVPNGVAKGGGVAAGNGLAVTQLWDYDSTHLKDRSIVHAFAGAAPVTDPKTNADGSLVLDGNNQPTLQFVRAIKVTYSTAAPAA
nr:P22 phage major capsid protein family protein [Frondihabitans sp. VKM Ac-2883]